MFFRDMLILSNEAKKRVYDELTRIKDKDGEAFIFYSTVGDNGRELKRSAERA